MLPYHGRWRNAPKRALEREARLVMFAGRVILPGDDDYNMPKPGELPYPSDAEILAMSPEQVAKWQLIAAKRNAEGKRERPTATPKVEENIANTTADTAAKIADTLNGNTVRVDAQEDVTDDEFEDGQIEEDEQNVSYLEAKTVSDEMVETMGNFLHKIRSNRGSAKKFLSAEEYKDWVAQEEEVAKELGLRTKDRDLLDFIGKLEENETAGMPPNGVIAYARRTIKKRIEVAVDKQQDITHFKALLTLLDEADAIVQGKNPAKNEKDVSTAAAWSNLDDGEKTSIYEHIRETLKVDQALKEIKKDHATLVDLFSEDFADVDDKEKEMNKKKEGAAKTKPSDDTAAGFKFTNILNSLHNLPGNVGIEFYTPLEIWEALKKVNETMKGINQRKHALKIASFAEKLGDIVAIHPKYRHAREILRAGHADENAKIQKGYSEALGSSNWQPGFDSMFAPGELMDRSLDDKNMTMAILEYGASKGMLYGLKPGEFDWKSEKILGRWHLKDLVPSNWTDGQIDSYCGQIIYDNGNGEKKQQEVGEKIVQAATKIPQFMKALNEALEGKDLWQARGIVKKAMDKVDTGHMASIITTTFIRHLEKNPALGRVIPMNVLDQVGGEGKELNIGLLKFEQLQIAAWARKGSKDIREIPRLGNFIADVREYLQEKDETLKATDPDTITLLDELTARLMSCDTVKVGKNKDITCTIYDKRFDPYVGEVLKEPQWARGVPMDKNWDDFFVNASEFQRGSQVIYDSILAPDQTAAGFKHEPRAKYFLTNIERTHQALLKGIKGAKTESEKTELRAAAENFRNQTRAKLDGSIDKLLNSNVGTFMANRYLLEGYRAPVFVTLIQQGLLSLSLFEQAITRPSTGQEFAKAVVDQCLNKGLVAKSVHVSKVDAIKDPEEKERLEALENDARIIKMKIPTRQKIKKVLRKPTGQSGNTGATSADIDIVTPA